MHKILQLNQSQQVKNFVPNAYKGKKNVNKVNNSRNLGVRSGLSHFQCQICGKSGHKADRCFKLKDLLQAHAFSTMLASSSNNSTSISSNWLLNSYITNHLTSSNENVQNPSLTKVIIL